MDEATKRVFVWSKKVNELTMIMRRFTIWQSKILGKPIGKGASIAEKKLLEEPIGKGANNNSLRRGAQKEPIRMEEHKPFEEGKLPKKVMPIEKEEFKPSSEGKLPKRALVDPSIQGTRKENDKSHTYYLSAKPHRVEVEKNEKKMKNMKNMKKMKKMKKKK